MKFVRVLLLCVAVIVGCLKLAYGQSWRPVAATGTGPSAAGVPLLLTDGTIMIQQMDSSAWYKLTPSATGDYAAGTWTRLADLPSGYGPLYFASAVLQDGRVFVMGGEYNFGASVWTRLGALYDPITNVWTPLPPPPGFTYGGDMQCAVMPGGKLLLAHILDTQMAEFDPATMSWTAITATGKADRFDEEGWTLQPDGTMLTVDAIAGPGTEKYIPWLTKWIPCGPTPNTLVQSSSQEIGPAVLMRNGLVFATGAMGWNAIWTPGTKPLDTGIWSSAPMFPTVSGGQLDIADGPACLLPSGNVLCAASPGVFGTDTHFFEFNGTTLTEVVRPPRAASDSSYVWNLCVLPNGQVLATDFSSDVEIYTPTGAPQSTWRPTITTCPSVVSAGGTFTLTGTQLNGLSQTNAYGDDSTNAENYPLVRLTNLTTGHVFYCRTWNHSTMALATGSMPVSTTVLVPSAVEQGASQLEVVAGGIASAPFTVTVSGTSTNPLLITVANSAVNAGAANTTISLSGQFFGSSDVAQFTLNGTTTSLPTAFVNANSMTAVIPAALLAAPGTAQISTLTTGGVASNPVPYQIRGPLPTLTTVSPATAVAMDPDTPITLTGSNFVASDVVQWTNSAFPVDLVTTFVSPTQLTAVVPASLLTTGAMAGIAVRDSQGQRSANVPFIVASNAPVISSISPSSAVAGGPDLPITLTGALFRAGDVVRWTDGTVTTPLSTTYVSGTQLTAVIPAALTAVYHTGTVITVLDPTNQVSNSVNFNLTSNIPTLTSVDPTHILAGGPDLTITLTGTLFKAGDTVQWSDGSTINLSASIDSDTQITAVVPAASLQTARTATLTVTDAAGQVSNGLTFTVDSDAPQVVDISPTFAQVGDPDTTIVITGSLFKPTDTVIWSDGVNFWTLPASIDSDTQITATVPAALLADGNFYAITVMDTLGQSSYPWYFEVDNPVPLITQMTPGGAMNGSSNLTITVTGSGFVPSSQVYFASSLGQLALTTTYVSDTTLKAVIPSSRFDNQEIAQVWVTNPYPGGGDSNYAPFYISGELTVTSVTPNKVFADAPATIVIKGTGFMQGAIGMFGGQGVRGTFISSTEMDFQVDARYLKKAGTMKVGIRNPGGVLSPTVSLTVQNPTPTLATMTPSSATHGSAAITITLTGTNFTNQSVVKMGSTNLTTTYLGPNQLTAVVPATKLTTAGTATVTVSNPAPGGASNGLTFTIR